MIMFVKYGCYSINSIHIITPLLYLSTTKFPGKRSLFAALIVSLNQIQRRFRHSGPLEL